MEVERNRQERTIKLTQKQYVTNVLKNFGMSDSKPVNTPMVPLTQPQPLDASKKNESKKEKPYQNAIGSLLYLAISTRPDISFAVTYLSQFNNNYTEENWMAVKRIMRYLKGTPEKGLLFRADDSELSGFSDADWGGNFDRRSFSGYVFKLSGSAISWKCKKQKSVALSSTESEYVAVSDTAKEASYLRILWNELFKEEICVPLSCDNQSAISIAENPVSHERTKHIDIRKHYVRELVQEGKVTISFIPTQIMVADGLTKPLHAPKHAQFLQLVGLCT